MNHNGHPPRCCVHEHGFAPKFNWVAVVERMIATFLGGGILWVVVRLINWG